MRNIAFILFGSTGDLAQKKIFPALEALYEKGELGDTPFIVAIGRREWTRDQFIDFLEKSSGIHSKKFLSFIEYVVIDIEKGKGYDTLKDVLKQGGIRERKVFYYTSLAPNFHGQVAEALRDVGLLYRATRSKPGPSLLIEKPFGSDLKSARKLDRLLSSFLDDSQIYRIDHYVGKGTMSAIMDLHEASADFSKLLSTKAVSEIRVELFEEKGISDRGASYDHVGAFRDIGQNHMLEMLALITLEPSGDFPRDRAKILGHLAPPKSTCELSRRGQYEGYQKEKGVAPYSTTETAFEVITHFGKGKLKGVPLVLSAGKKIAPSRALIEVLFKNVEGLPKKMIFSLQPTQEIVIEHQDGSKEIYEIPRGLDAYSTILLAAFRGSSREFVGRAEIEALWSYTDHVIACWNKVPLEIYGKTRPFLIN